MANFNAEEYRRASHEKFNAASHAAQGGHYVVAHYLAGVAVECMLRAFRFQIDRNWDAGHDLTKLLKGSGVLGKVSGSRGGRLQEAFNSLAIRWSVSHRYAPTDRLEKYLFRAKLEIGPKETRLRRDTQTMLQCAQIIIEECENVY